MELSPKNYCEIDLFDFTSVLAWTFLNFLAHSADRPPELNTESIWYHSVFGSVFSGNKK